MQYTITSDGRVVADFELESVKDVLPLLTERAARVDVPAIDWDVIDADGLTPPHSGQVDPVTLAMLAIEDSGLL